MQFIMYMTYISELAFAKYHYSLCITNNFKRLIRFMLDFKLTALVFKRLG